MVEHGRITAPHFCAGLECKNGFVFGTAPILHYMLGWTRDKVMRYCAQKGWAITWKLG